jgi:hypothetical protein
MHTSGVKTPNARARITSPNSTQNMRNSSNWKTATMITETLSPCSSKAKHGPTSSISRGLTLQKTKEFIVDLFTSKHKNDE